MANALSQVPEPVNEPVRAFLPKSEEKEALKKELARQQGLCVDIPLVIGAQKVMDRSTEPVICPHRRSLTLAQARMATREDCHQAIAASLAARSEWAALPWEERASVFMKAADLLTSKYRDKICAATMLGQSKTCHQAEIEAACELADFLRFNVAFAQRVFEEQPMHSPFGQWNRSQARGLEGFVFAIGPFNFTAISVNMATAPALMGCSVLWKPSHTALLASYYMLEVLEEAGLPPGVINLLMGDPALIGGVVMESEHLAGVHFTGSTRTFDHIWSEVGQKVESYRSYPRIVGETGGKDFVLAHESADVDQLVAALVRGAFEYQGQKCSAASRAYIPKSLWAQVRTKLVETTASVTMGDPSDFTNFMGAVIDERSFQKIRGYIEQAKKSSDGKVLVGGECDDRQGFFVRPTVIETTNPTFVTMVEEIFGPVLTVYPYDDDADLADIVKLVDESTPYSLTGAIFARDRRVIAQLTNALEGSAGNFYINDKPTGAVVGQQPFGGGRRSGTNDKAGSMLNLLRWVSYRTIKENFLDINDYRYPFMDER